ncbi:glycosyltransferase [Streptomyces sp. NRRL S-350]|uniref:glycosyltransferase n=1 Tax=Streptomyces sp. NRRL S-350 TaxID=1463902 RepID=UPI00068A6FFB|nr:glycosyltransferase [Streptomyces sp. NRRL S-350]
MTGHLKVSLVSEHASPLAVLGGVDAGGQNVHVAALAGALADLGHQVVVHTRRDSPDLPDEVRMRPGVTVHHVPAGPARPVPKDQLLPYMAEFGDVLADYWGRRRPDVVHSHFWMSGLAALRGARRLGIPVAHTYHALGTVKRRHQGADDTSPAQRIALEAHLGRSTARVIATCSDEVTELLAMDVPADRIRVVPCGVDHRRFSPQGERAPRTAPHRLLAVGRLVPRKGGATALEALAQLPGTELVIAGGPPADRLDTDPEGRRLRSLAADLGLTDRLVLLGGVPSTRMPALLRSADLVVCPAQYEPFGIVPLEAMACGVPVVATAVGGHLDTVADGRTGLLVPAGSGAALAAAAAGLLRDPLLRRAYGAAGRRRVLAFYGWDRVAAGTEKVYREMVRPPGPALPPRVRTGAPVRTPSGGL